MTTPLAHFGRPVFTIVNLLTGKNVSPSEACKLPQSAARLVLDTTSTCMSVPSINGTQAATISQILFSTDVTKAAGNLNDHYPRLLWKRFFNVELPCTDECAIKTLEDLNTWFNRPEIRKLYDRNLYRDGIPGTGGTEEPTTAVGAATPAAPTTTPTRDAHDETVERLERAVERAATAVPARTPDNAQDPANQNPRRRVRIIQG